MSLALALCELVGQVDYLGQSRLDLIRDLSQELLLLLAGHKPKGGHVLGGVIDHRQLAVVEHPLRGEEAAPCGKIPPGGIEILAIVVPLPQAGVVLNIKRTVGFQLKTALPSSATLFRRFLVRILVRHCFMGLLETKMAIFFQDTLSYQNYSYQICEN